MVPIMVDGSVCTKALKRIDPGVNIIAVSGFKENVGYALVTATEADAFLQTYDRPL
jgi:hypothetical protein